ncbi:MAG: ParB/RepB/Spo0J family partition protein [Clostridia bacterium]|nr:ParB/RepB/Spo0J family partition protein [Clostridia bacterium]
MSSGKLVNISVNDIIPNENQPRKNFDEYELSLLCESIKENGVLQPLVIRVQQGKYLLIAGERRLRAAKMAGLKRVPCIIRKADDLTADCFTIIENLLRRDLSVFEEAEGISRLINVYGISQCEVAEKIGIAQSTLSNKLRLLKLDSILRQRITAARLSERHARALLRIPEEKRSEALDYIIAKQLTIPETEEYIDKLLSPKREKVQPIRKCAIGDVRLFANSLAKMVDTMRLGGISATTTKNETDTHIEYTVLITK